MREIILSGALLVLAGAFNITINKYARNVPDGLIIAMWLAPLVPLVWWTITHPKLIPHRQWYKERFRTSKIASILVTAVVVVISTIYLGSAGYRAWKLLTKSDGENVVNHSPTTSQVTPVPSPDKPAPTETRTGKPIPSAKPPKRPSVAKSGPTAAPAPKSTLPIQNCPNGNCIGGDNNGTATVNNFGPPEPNAMWKVERTQVEEQSGQVLTWITLSVDRSMEIPAFLATCDRPCKSRSATAPGYSQSTDLTIANSPNWAGFVFIAPRPLGAGVKS